MVEKATKRKQLESIIQSSLKTIIQEVDLNKNDDESSKNIFDINEQKLTLKQRISEALDTVKLRNIPSYILSVIPLHSASIPNMFSSKENLITSLMSNPPQIRDSGFNLFSGRDVKIVRGELLRCNWEKHSILEFGQMEQLYLL
ncbi:MAG: hypothetical protein ACD_79C00577G0001 [uncultured bacterium]|nr:MAG: hypothetical protein ACD_79C00577G0001 [uncultured bacterium]